MQQPASSGPPPKRLTPSAPAHADRPSVHRRERVSLASMRPIASFEARPRTDVRPLSFASRCRALLRTPCSTSSSFRLAATKTCTPYPEHPGCVYGEMHKLRIEPCGRLLARQEQYAAESRSSQSVLRQPRREHALLAIATERDRALRRDGVRARRTVARAAYQKVKFAAQLADELVIRPIPQLRAVIDQAAAKAAGEDELRRCCHLSGLKEAASSGPNVSPRSASARVKRADQRRQLTLLAQPLMLQAVPLEGEHWKSSMKRPLLRNEQKAS